MNRKMRTKLANKQAKATKERRCPQADKIVISDDQTNCDSCGADLVSLGEVSAVMVELPRTSKETLH
jgi:hypothetical protein